MNAEFDEMILAAITEDRPLTPSERLVVDLRHPLGKPGGACGACRFVFRTGARSCPSRLFVERGARAALDALPSATTRRQCRQCHQTVEVLAGTKGKPLCDSCQDQPSLFEGDAP